MAWSPTSNCTTVTRQDDFLRSLIRTIDLNLNTTPDYGLRVLKSRIEQRLPELKPVAYEGHELSAGLSWGNGYVICGDNKSIRAAHEASNVESFWRPAYLRSLKS